MILGMVVRDDQGGLGNLTFEAWTHLQPAVTVVVQSRPCRGVPRPQVFTADFTETHYVNNPVTADEWTKFAPLADVWWSAETWYCDDAERILADAGCRSVLYVMPEYFAGSDATDLWNPTGYLHDRLPDRAKVMPWPTSPPPSWRLRTRVQRILHISGGASSDRNGTQAFVQALRLVNNECDVLVHQPDANNRLPASAFKTPGHVRLRQTTDYHDTLTGLYQWADLLVLPRRYAGLCLPALEAAATGCLVAMPNVAPQDEWPIITFPATPARPLRLKGGRIPAWDTDPQVLARLLDTWMEATPHPVVRASEEMRAWAETRAWSRQRGVWLWHLSK
jgi:hypothetical protein